VTTPDPLTDSSAQIIVGRVIDGDTFVIGIKQDSFSVRILGIDAFEIKHDARLDSQAVKAHISIDSAYALGQAGKHFADSLLSKKAVLLVRDPLQPDFDVYNRLLRHVFYYDGGTTHDFGALMIGKGLALVDTL
jgi:endonuclease YncB( thermonuclease family)